MRRLCHTAYMSSFATEFWPETHSQVEFLPAALPPDLLVTAVKIYVFRGDSVLLTDIATRGWDVPGGHVEAGETPEQTVVRELREETGARVEKSALIGYLKITNTKETTRNKKYPKVSCMLVYKGYGARLDAGHSFELEARGCQFTPLEELAHVHHGWNDAKAQVMAYAFSHP